MSRFHYADFSYDCPKYVDFEDPSTFATTDETVEAFWRARNGSDSTFDFGSDQNAENRAPSSADTVQSLDEVTDESFKTPEKSSVNDSQDAYFSSKSYSFRSTSQRDLINKGETPYREPGRVPSSRKKSRRRTPLAPRQPLAEIDNEDLLVEHTAKVLFITKEDQKEENTVEMKKIEPVVETTKLEFESERIPEVVIQIEPIKEETHEDEEFTLLRNNDHSLILESVPEEPSQPQVLSQYAAELVTGEKEESASEESVDELLIQVCEKKLVNECEPSKVTFEVISEPENNQHCLCAESQNKSILDEEQLEGLLESVHLLPHSCSIKHVDNQDSPFIEKHQQEEVLEEEITQKILQDLPQENLLFEKESEKDLNKAHQEKVLEEEITQKVFRQESIQEYISHEEQIDECLSKIDSAQKENSFRMPQQELPIEILSNEELLQSQPQESLHSVLSEDVQNPSDTSQGEMSMEEASPEKSIHEQPKQKLKGNVQERQFRRPFPVSFPRKQIPDGLAPQERLHRLLSYTTPIKVDRYKTLAELEKEFERTTRLYPETPSTKRSDWHPTRPISPKLSAIKRRRQVTFISHAQAEAMVAENLKKNAFKATPYNKSKFMSRISSSVKKFHPTPSTKPKPFSFLSDKRLADRKCHQNCSNFSMISNNVHN